MSQQLGLNYQMSPEVMYITPNIWRLGIIFISVKLIKIVDALNCNNNFGFGFNVILRKLHKIPNKVQFSVITESIFE